MKTKHTLSRSWLRLLTFACGWLATSLAIHAQATGTIQGRVYNPATQQYVRNAEVRLEGTNQVTATESDGSFSFQNVPAGSANITVTYTGYATATEAFTVSPGQTVTREINISSTQGGARAGDSVVQLQAFTVSTEREGNAKAIMEQRRNMNITTSVASDVFGDVTDGNVGEFLKYLPGVDLDYVEPETRGPRLGGMDGQYVGVSFDGVKLASADANRTGDAGRATSFEAFSISSVESIEISRTTSPDSDADSPAGTINMKTRRAFDRKGRRIGYNFSINMNSDEFTFKKTMGQDRSEKDYKWRPNYSFEYSDVFLNNRLGIVASHSHADAFYEQYRHNMTFNKTPTATDPRGIVITNLNFKDGPKDVGKDTYTLTADFKATQRLVLSFTTIYNTYDATFYNREFTFNAANNNANVLNGRSTVGGDGVTTVQTSLTTGPANAANTFPTVAQGGGNANKLTHTITLFPKFEYRLSSWTFDGAATYSRSFNDYEALESGFTRSAAVNSIASHFVATRPSIQSHEWTIQQTAGPDWFNLANWTNPRVTNEGRYAKTEIYTGELNARWVLPQRRFPTVLKFGGKWNEEFRNNGNTTSYETWSYVGPGGNVLTGRNPTTGDATFTSTGTWAAFPNAHVFDTGTTNILTVKNSAGQVGPIPRPDNGAIASLFRDHPEYFVSNATADNYYNAFVAPRRRITQTVTAAYGMADIRVTDKLAFRTGVRWEKTENIAKEYDPKTNREVAAAGFQVNTAARPTSIEGVQYQYFTNPLVERRKEYDNFFPMISTKYSFNRNFQFQAGFNKAISRPPVDSLTGAWLINDDAQLITGPNPNLLPEYSKNYAARLAYYFEPAGQLSIGVAQNNIQNLRETRRGTAEEFGLGDDPDYAGYEFQSPFNVAAPRRFRNMEIAYNQSLPFQHEALRGITVNTAYARTYVSQRRGGVSPHRVSGSLGYSYKRLRTRLGVVWHSDTPWDTGSYGRYKRATAKYDLGGEFRLTRYASLFFTGRNIFNDSQNWYESPVIEGEAGVLRILENYGTSWVFGVKGTF